MKHKSFKVQFLTITIILGMMIGLISSNTVLAENNIPTSIERPQSFTARVGDQEINLRWKVPQSILNLIGNSDGGDAIVYAIDWKQDNGAWNFDNKLPGDPCYLDNYFDSFGVFYGYQGNMLADENNMSETFLVGWHLYPQNDTNAVFDFKNSTYYFRMRFLFEYTNANGETKYIASPYTDVVALGKNASNTAVTKLDAPQNLKAQVKKDSNGKPYFVLNWTIPESVKEANKSLPVYHKIDFKVGDGKWYSEINGISELPIAPSSLLSSTDEFDPVEKELLDEVVIEANTYYFRILFEAEPTIDKFIHSAYSNVASIGIEKYSNASPWAVPELNKAAEYGLITDSIKNKMSQPITSEEFAELSVRLYELYTGKKAEAVSPNPFKDCANSEILKAFKLGIINGVSTDKFDPKALTNREQIAAMLNRAAKVIKPEADFSTVGAPVFADEKQISSWAIENVRYMAKVGFIGGTGNNKFSPKDTATCEQAVLIAVRVYEAFK